MSPGEIAIVASAVLAGLATLVYLAPSRAWKMLAESLETRVSNLESAIVRLEAGIRQRDVVIAQRDAVIVQRDGVIRRLRSALHYSNGQLFKAGLKNMIVEPGSVVEMADEIVPDMSYPFMPDEADPPGV